MVDFKKARVAKGREAPAPKRDLLRVCLPEEAFRVTRMTGVSTDFFAKIKVERNPERNQNVIPSYEVCTIIYMYVCTLMFVHTV